MRKIIVATVLALMLVVSAAVPAFADEYAEVTVTATPLYLAITSTGASSWAINDLGTGEESGKGVIKTSAIYYTKAVNDGDDTTPPGATVASGDCIFQVTNDASASVCDLVVTWSDFSLGGANMLNSDDGSTDATHFSGYVWYEGMLYANKVKAKTTGSVKMYTVGLVAGGTLNWGAEIETQTGGWTSTSPSESTLTITAVAH